jgi:type VI secretion system protein
MALRLEIVSRHRQSLGERGQIEFGQDGGTIGRSLESDWVLPDGQRFLSSRHASIDFRSGSFYIIDLSTNGVYINDSHAPVGRGKPQRLFSNDRIRIGEYEILVDIDDIDNTKETLMESSHVDPVDVRQRVDAPDPTTYDLVDAYEITGVGIEMLLDEDETDTLTPSGGELTLEFQSGHRRSIASVTDTQALPADALALAPETPPPTPARPAARAASSPPAKAQAPAQSARAAASAPAKAPPAAPSNDKPAAAQAAANSGAYSQALDVLLHGAGLAAKKLDEKDAAQTLLSMGRIVREIIVGLNENLYLRSAHKNMLKQPNTTIQPRSNNPLKFSASTDEALENLLFRKSEEYLQPVAAVRDAFDDIKWHQHALVKALAPAVSNYAAHLDPDRLEERISKGRTGALMGAANKLRYWDLYKDLYVVVTQHPDGELPPQFITELAEAYEHEQTRTRPKREPKSPGNASVKTTAG